MRSIRLFLVLCLAPLLANCGGYGSMSNNNNNTIAPTVTGPWMITFTPSGQSSAQATTLNVNFSQSGSNLTATVSSVNNPDTACFPFITSQSSFTITGQAVAQSQSNSNLTISVSGTSGSSSGTIMGTGALAYLGTTGSGTFSFAAGPSGCTSGTFTMTQG